MDEEDTTNSDQGSSLGIEWKKHFEEASLVFRHDDLKSSVVRELQYAASACYEIVREPILNISLKQELFEKLVISPLEWFLFGENPCEGKRKLLDLNNPPTLCAKVFKSGEPTYSCRYVPRNVCLTTLLTIYLNYIVLNLLEDEALLKLLMSTFTLFSHLSLLSQGSLGAVEGWGDWTLMAGQVMGYSYSLTWEICSSPLP